MATPKYKHSLLVTLLGAARACIPIYWKSGLNQVNSLMRMEDLLSSLPFTAEKFTQKWYYWMECKTSTDYTKLYTEHIPTASLAQTLDYTLHSGVQDE